MGDIYIYVVNSTNKRLFFILIVTNFILYMAIHREYKADIT